MAENESSSASPQSRFAHNATVRAWVEALFPVGQHLPAPDSAKVADSVNRYFDSVPGLEAAIGALLRSLEMRFWLSHGRSFAGASLKQRRAFIETHGDSLVAGPLLRALATPFRIAYLLDERVLAKMGTHNGIQVPEQVESFRWQSQVTVVDELERDQVLQADVVVVGTGAGGAVAAYELASRGLAVVILEEGHYYDRRDFNGNLTEVIPKLYRGSGSTVAIGNTIIPVPVGRNVGGTTTINSGTCLRTPESVLRQWVDWGLSDLTPAMMAPLFDEVEEVLQVQDADPKYVGPLGDIIGRGAMAMGFSKMHPLQRNAVGCDGQGLCQFGCPTDAKQSTNVSYIPRALDKGAFLFTGLKASQLSLKGNSIHGIRAQGVGADGVTRNLMVQASQVVVAMGSFFTPLFLQQNGIRNPWLGANLSIHPAGAVTGYYPDNNFANTQTIPQGYGISDWADQGIMFEGGTPPFVAHGILNPMTGHDFVDFTESYQNTAYFGFMIKDSSRGKVRQGLHPDVPLITYNMNKADFRQFLKATRMLAKIHLKAGAEYVHLGGLAKYPKIYTEAMVDTVIESGLKPRHFTMSAYHPLGTCRIAPNPGNGVCDMDHQVFGVEGLTVMDGSSVPSSLGANPQVTIMALATRAARRLADRINR
ncbi:MAG: GMC family oxidoreductase N-terminal domain-containing protein [Pseudomonadales bacterium]|nr:GMC family oxidoreductase N-terminal domain-containing protein [Pseudomonadales bacterium]